MSEVNIGGGLPMSHRAINWCLQCRHDHTHGLAVLMLFPGTTTIHTHL